jgi:hypothetical protein
MPPPMQSLLPHHPMAPVGVIPASGNQQSGATAKPVASVSRKVRARSEGELAFLPAALEIVERPTPPLANAIGATIIALFCAVRAAASQPICSTDRLPADRGFNTDFADTDGSSQSAQSGPGLTGFSASTHLASSSSQHSQPRHEIKPCMSNTF